MKQCANASSSTTHAAPKPIGSELPHLARRRALVERARRHGASVLSDEELVALLLSSGERARAAKAIDACDGIARLARATPNALWRELGLDAASASRLSAAFELGRRAAVESAEAHVGERMNAEAIARWATPRLVTLEHEEVWVVCLDGRTRLLGARQVGKGGAHGCALLPRDVLIPVVREAANAFVVVHNHPSGDPTPSREDREMTLALARAADVISVPLLDHVVVARGGYRSMLELGLFDR